ncbi:MAG TPA: DUF4846 domain-containing protein [Clostridia bacterium]|nr:DUF4846 domain-containing protein [Clostridia bacterium]
MKKPVLKLLVLFAVCAITIYTAEEGLFNGNHKSPANSEQYGISADAAVPGGIDTEGTAADGGFDGLVAGSADNSGNAAGSNVGGETGNQTGNEAVNSADSVAEKNTGGETASLINPEGGIVQERIRTPEGFLRVDAGKGSFAEYLRNLPLKPDGSKVVYYNGEIKPRDVHAAVIDLDVGSRDLQQCADSVIRLRAEYLYGKGLYEKIHFNFTNGFNAEYSNWIKGRRISVSGNKAGWTGGGSTGTGYESFRSYLDMVFAYAGTLSLSKEMKNIPIEDMQPGDVFVKGASPGHCVIVLDMAFNEDTGGKCYLLAQGYMPAQDMHVLKNPAKQDGDPWYSAGSDEEIVTPEWVFTKDQLYRFND